MRVHDLSNPMTMSQATTDNTPQQDDGDPFFDALFSLYEAASEFITDCSDTTAAYDALVAKVESVDKLLADDEDDVCPTCHQSLHS